jgi:hypothetical protein
MRPHGRGDYHTTGLRPFSPEPLHYNPAVELRSRRTSHRLCRAGLVCAAGALLVFASTARGTPDHPRALDSPGLHQSPSFASQIAALSEPNGYFDTDNLISNERSYLQVMPELGRRGVHGGAYIGVGPDTNFSYIAAVRPAVAVIIDVRRDNLLLHLLFKALFAQSATRAEYLALLLGRPVPPASDGWRAAPIERVVAHFGRTGRTGDSIGLRRRLGSALERIGVPLSADDMATMARFHQRFIDEGVDLRFHTTGRAPQSYYPTYRDLLLETDADGRQANYLASEDAFQFVKSLHARDLIIPVVGDLSGPSAMQAIGRMLTARREPLSVFYTSNVEYYLYGQGTFARFAENLRHIPHAERSMMIRSVFGRYSGFGRPGDASTSQLQPVQELLRGVADGRFRSYAQLVASR